MSLTCQELPPIPYEMYGGTGGFLKGSDASEDRIVICGGYNRYGKSLSNCWSLVNEDFNISMNLQRNYASGIVIGNNMVSNLL